jgi:hypothetical protein
MMWRHLYMLAFHGQPFACSHCSNVNFPFPPLRCKYHHPKGIHVQMHEPIV